MIRTFLRILPILLLPASAFAASSPVAVTAEGGDLRAQLPDGRVLRGAELVGVVLPFQGAELRVDAARPDDGARAGDVWLYRLSVRGTDGQWSESCEAGAQAMVFPGPAGAVRLTCSAGAIGTCIRLGYRPWASTAEGVALAPYHRACVNLLRSAEDKAARIEVYDRIGIRPAPAPDAVFDAGWTVEGPVCLADPGPRANDPQAEIALAIMAMTGRTGRDGCTEDRAAALGALVFNRIPAG
ncbi:hypothetical protein EJV46_10940 [Roseococcus sp. SYP-B2431]|uniref:ADYC domain-containing protein n=1 Tax=Roseococcus sp. SYP-B2431 TaxID=2496640 RepID=UPI00103AF301|nr:ADYC domain-containing protein [Roseococcus sp. SYP-B2431]TCH99049.1 hypothetical protein EJV46_10940 [Roseococcus sp. SYP-B2431]